MLTDVTVNDLKPQDKSYKVVDTRGLYIMILPSGAKSFRYDYRFKSKQKKTFCIGLFPDINIQKARERLQNAQILLANGIDPCIIKKVLKIR